MPESEVPPGSIVITPKQFYDGVKEDIAEIKEAVAPLSNLVHEVDDHEVRIRALERFRWSILGAAAIASAFVTTAVNRMFT